MKRTILIIAGLAAIYLIASNAPVASDGRGQRGGSSRGGRSQGGRSQGGRSQGDHRQGGRSQGDRRQGGGSQGDHRQGGGFHSSRSGNTISRTPSMSRSEPIRRGANVYPQGHVRGGRGHRASQGEVKGFLDGTPRSRVRPMDPGHGFTPAPSLPGQSGSGLLSPRGVPVTPPRALQGRPGSGVITNPGKPFAQSPSLHGRAGPGVIQSPRRTGGRRILHQAPQGFNTSFPRKRMDNRQVSRHVRERVKQNRPELFHGFNDRFFDDRRFHPFHHSRGANWWCSAVWPGVIGWLGWGWNYPLYYDDTGSAYPDTTYQSYYNELEGEQEFPLSNQQAVQGDWLSLGIFTLGQSTEEAPFSNIVIQLALDKQGKISGTYYNTATDQTYLVEGSVDKETQEATWKLSDDPFAPIMSTGIYNLTQDLTDVQVQFPEGTVQNWVLVRLNS